MRLSVLDLSPVPSGQTAAQALANTLDLAAHAESLGYARYWLAEHHNAAAVASSSPEILIAEIAARTTAIRVGAGGIMLPNHSALKVAETFRVLHALHPERIDLGIGRAAGTDNKTALALRRSRELLGAEGFPAQLDDLLELLARDPDPNLPFGELKAVPTGIPAPELWILGSGGDGAAIAAERGLGFAFAHHFNPADAIHAIHKYRAAFVSSPHFGSPHAMLAVSVICGEDDAHAERLATSGELAWLRFGQGLRDLPLPTVEEALAYEYDGDEEALKRQLSERHIVGGPERVGEALRALVRATGVGELIVTTHVHSHEERRRSYERLAALELGPRTA
jgi:luciferase family oxidoreductase group 1